MDKSAILQIQESSHIPEIITQLAESRTHVPAVVTPSGFCIDSLEHLMEQRSSYRLKYATESIKDFIAYGVDFDQVGATCFVNSASMTALNILDLGTLDSPLHQKHKAELTLKETAAYKSILSVDGSHLSQKKASDFIEDWADNLVAFTNDGTTMTAKSAAAALRNLTIDAAKEVNSKIGDYSESMSVMEKIEARNIDKLPAEIHFKCVPYLHLEERRFVIRLSLLTSSEKPQLIFRISKLESVKEEMAEEFKGILLEGFNGQETKVYMGTA